jgi:hypothetical protein
MRNTFRVSIISFIAVGGIFLLLPMQDYDPDSGCRPSLSRQAKHLVQEDYLKSRFPYWQIEKKMLGTLTPHLSFGKVTIEDEAYHVPFTAHGPDAKLVRVGVIDCGLQEIDYTWVN